MIQKSALSELSIERARVIAIPSKSDSNLDTDDDVLWVETMAKESCGSCSANTTCGHSILGRWFTRRRQCIPVGCRKGEASLLAVGQWVEVGMPVSLIVRASLVAYMLPLVGLLIGTLLFSQFAMAWQLALSVEMSSIIGAVVGLLLGVWAAKRVSQRLLNGDQLPRLIGVVSSS